MKTKDIVRSFYELDLATESDVMRFFHQDCKLHWNSSKGFLEMSFADIKKMLDDVRKSYVSFKYKLSHLLGDDDTVTARYTVYVVPIEKAEEDEEPLAHFISIWEIKDGKFYRGYEISQMADENPASLNTFSEIKV